jgi:hypothetical protein
MRNIPIVKMSRAAAHPSTHEKVVLPLGGDHRYRYRLLRTCRTDCDSDCDPDADTEPDGFGFLLLLSNQYTEKI